MKSTINKTLMALSLLIVTSFAACAQKQEKASPAKTTKKMDYNKLTKEEEDVIVRKGTEYPGTGKYDKFNEKGTYTCKRCNAPLYTSDSKFDAHCGWPAFDDEIKYFSILVQNLYIFQSLFLYLVIIFDHLRY